MASEPSHKRKRTAIDAQASSRRAPASRAGGAERRDQGQRREGTRERNGAAADRAAREHGGHDRAKGPGEMRRTRVPYAEHGVPYRVRNGRMSTAQHARVTGPRAGRAARAERQGEAPRHGAAPAREASGSRAKRAGGGQGQKLVLQSPPMGGSARLLDPAAAARSRWAKAGVAVAVAAVVAFAGLRVASCGSAPEAGEPDAAQPAPTAPARSNILEERLATYPAYQDPDPTDLSAISGGEGVVGFSLGDPESVELPALSPEHASAIDEALEPFESDGFDASFLLMDVGTGRGIAYNLDESIYGASSFKGPYCAYVAESYVDGGQVAVSEVSDDFFNIIVYSDNDTYDAMRARFPDSKLVLWLDSIGVASSVAYDTWYPHYTARDSAKLWMATYNYLKGGGSTAEALAKHFGRTDTSFMRTAVTEAAEEANAAVEEEAEAEEATFGSEVSALLDRAVREATVTEVAVYDKAGWYPRDQDDVPAMVDAGIVECNGRDYLLCVLTDMPWSEPNQEDAEALIAAVFSTRSDLG